MGTNYGTNATVAGSTYLNSAWQEGIQYVVFRSVVVTNSSQAVVLTAFVGSGGNALLSGLQIAKSSGSLQFSVNLTNFSVLYGTDTVLSVQASSGTPVSYQWYWVPLEAWTDKTVSVPYKTEKFVKLTLNCNEPDDLAI